MVLILIMLTWLTNYAPLKIYCEVIIAAKLMVVLKVHLKNYN
jgi:hypothetical protein